MKFAGKILLVDDEAHIRKFVGLLLRKHFAATILEAADGMAALDVYAQEKPDLVLLDVNMPHLDGIQTLERLRLADPEVNVVMLTSLTNRHTVDDCLRLGAIDYIRKDTPKDDLAIHLQRIVNECFPEDLLPAPAKPEQA